MNCKGKVLFSDLRNGKKNVGRCVRGFFKDSRHAGFHFSYLTTTPPLNENIRENLELELGEPQTDS